jgi:HD-like signal output (HDOD) protein
VDDTHWASPQELVDVERAALGYDHALLGWHACQKWSLPAPIGEVVRRHHEPLSPDPSEPLNLIRVVQRADVLSVALILHPELAQAPAEELARRLAAEYPSLGAVDEPSEWHSLVQIVYDKSMQWARQLKLIHPEDHRAAG